jgi:hypothetical protein
MYYQHWFKTRTDVNKLNHLTTTIDGKTKLYASLKVFLQSLTVFKVGTNFLPQIKWVLKNYDYKHIDFTTVIHKILFPINEGRFYRHR